MSWNHVLRFGYGLSLEGLSSCSSWMLTPVWWSPERDAWLTGDPSLGRDECPTWKAWYFLLKKQGMVKEAQCSQPGLLCPLLLCDLFQLRHWPLFQVIILWCHLPSCGATREPWLKPSSSEPTCYEDVYYYLQNQRWHDDSMCECRCFKCCGFIRQIITHSSISILSSPGKLSACIILSTERRHSCILVHVRKCHLAMN